MNEQQWQQLSERMGGVEMPPAPDWWPLVWTVTGLVVATLIITWLLRRQRKTTTTANSEALTRLAQLQQAWDGGELEPRRAAYQLATLLRLGLGLNQLSPTPPQELSEQQAQWRETVELLQQLRYQSPSHHTSQARLTQQTFGQIQDWLSRGSEPC
jgi:hypothetical protein